MTCRRAHTVTDLDDHDIAAYVRTLFEERAGHALVAWTQYFDRNHDRKVSEEEWMHGMEKLGYQGDAKSLYKRLDEDNSGFLTISEICPMSSDLWASFQHWAAKTFFSEEDMIEKLSGRKFQEKKKNAKITEDKGMTRKQFFNFASSLGWYGGFEQILFMSMDQGLQGTVYTHMLPWFEEERNRQIKKLKYKKHGKDGGMTAMRRRLHALRSLQAFTQWLRYRYGPKLFHPWRRGLDKDGSMNVTRLELQTFCKNAGWRGDVNALWHALDADESGSTSLDEFAGSEARELALFRTWVIGRFGTIRKALRAFCAKVQNKTLAAAKVVPLDKSDFTFAVEGLGYEHDAGEIFEILDWEAEGDKMITYKELRCLEAWEPVDWLTAEKNEEAAELFKSMLFAKYKHPLKAWRALDEDVSGKVNFREFTTTAARLGFKGDLQGAWMALDSDASGYIALTEVNPRGAHLLAEFRRWANLFFGSVMNAFMVLDADGGGALTRSEFKKSATKYCFRGDREELFTLLDIGGDGDITVEEMAFLDEWEITEVCDEPIPTFHEVERMLRRSKSPYSDEDSGSEGDANLLLPEVYAGLPPRTRCRTGTLKGDMVKEVFQNEIVHRPMAGTDLLDFLGGDLSKERPLSPRSPQSHSTSNVFNTSILPSTLNMSATIPGSKSLCSPKPGYHPSSVRRRSYTGKDRWLRNVPYRGGIPFMKKPTTPRKANYCTPSGHGLAGFPLPLCL